MSEGLVGRKERDEGGGDSSYHTWPSHRRGKRQQDTTTQDCELNEGALVRNDVGICCVSVRDRASASD